jgi:peptidoglycan biosynthesis protein MviN/MurJ (putative lipid II flippase)
MRKLSYWAKRNPWKSRIIIIVSHLLLMLLGWYTGTSFFAMDISLPAYLFVFFILYYLAAVFIYPSKDEKKRNNRKWIYIKQKACDFSLAAAAYGMMVCISNQPGIFFNNFQKVSGSLIINPSPVKVKPTAAEILESLKYRDKSKLTHEEKRILKKEFKVQLKNYVVAKLKGNKEGGDQTFLIILAIVAALGIAYLLAALSCTLSCNGNEGAAVLVVILGIIAIGLGLYFVIKAINKGAKNKPEPKNGA